jgi:aerobic-type carbon monoxide dehydrogenase small subunit (CoxS/CutS family)
MFRLVKFSINGRPLWVELRSETEHLSGLLRSLGIVGPKAACDTGQCVACTVLVGDNPVRSCTLKSEGCVGKDVTTAERLDCGPSVHPMLSAQPVSPSLFDDMVRDGRMPQPIRVDSRLLWDPFAP